MYTIMKTIICICLIKKHKFSHLILMVHLFYLSFSMNICLKVSGLILTSLEEGSTYIQFSFPTFSQFHIQACVHTYTFTHLHALW